jgi:hypothetical protein
MRSLPQNIRKYPRASQLLGEALATLPQLNLVQPGDTARPSLTQRLPTAVATPCCERPGGNVTGIAFNVETLVSLGRRRSCD